MEQYKNMPINIRVEKAKNELRSHINRICYQYDFPGCILNLLLDSVRLEECQQQLSYTCEQVEGLKDQIKSQNDQIEIENGVVDHGNSK